MRYDFPEKLIEWNLKKIDGMLRHDYFKYGCESKDSVLFELLQNLAWITAKLLPAYYAKSYFLHYYNIFKNDI